MAPHTQEDANLIIYAELMKTVELQQYASIQHNLKGARADCYTD